MAVPGMYIGCIYDASICVNLVLLPNKEVIEKRDAFQG